MQILIGSKAEPYLLQARVLISVHHRLANTAIHAAEIMGTDTFLHGPTQAAVAVCDKDCVPAVLTVRPLHGKKIKCLQVFCDLEPLLARPRRRFGSKLSFVAVQIDTLLVSARPKFNQPAVALALLKLAQMALRQDTVLLVSTIAANQPVYIKAGFQVLFRLIHTFSHAEEIMIWSNQSPLSSAVLKSLCGLDGRNPDCRPVVWGCCTRDCHAYGTFLCPHVRRASRSVDPYASAARS